MKNLRKIGLVIAMAAALSMPNKAHAMFPVSDFKQIVSFVKTVAGHVKELMTLKNQLTNSYETLKSLGTAVQNMDFTSLSSLGNQASFIAGQTQYLSTQVGAIDETSGGYMKKGADLVKKDLVAAASAYRNAYSLKGPTAEDMIKRDKVLQVSKKELALQAYTLAAWCRDSEDAKKDIEKAKEVSGNLTDMNQRAQFEIEAALSAEVKNEKCSRQLETYRLQLMAVDAMAATAEK